jgi:DNA recombination protein RmuC
MQDKNVAKKKHIDAIKKHVDTLHKKNYQTKVDESLDSIIMFMVNEASIHSLENDSKELIEYALDKNVTIVGPSQLYFLIKIVERMWATDKQSKNIKEVADIGSKIYDTVHDVYSSISKNKLVDGRNSLTNQVEKMKAAGNLITQTDINDVKEITINDPNAEVINLDKVTNKEIKR